MSLLRCDLLFLRGCGPTQQRTRACQPPIRPPHLRLGHWLCSAASAASDSPASTRWRSCGIKSFLSGATRMCCRGLVGWGGGLTCAACAGCRQRSQTTLSGIEVMVCHGTWHQQMPQQDQKACAHRDFDLLGGKAHERGAVQRAVGRRRRPLPQGGRAACAAERSFVLSRKQAHGRRQREDLAQLTCTECTRSPHQLCSPHIWKRL